jgi:ABC-type multidrug transport system fused ATPase/permease subunit
MEFFKDLKIIWIYLKKYKKTVFGTTVLVFGFALTNAVIPYLYGRLVDLVSNGSDFFLIFYLIGIWVVTSFVYVVFRWLVSLKGDFVAIDVMGDFVFEHFSHVINLPLTFHKEKKVGEVFSRITRGAEYLRDIISSILFWMAPQFLSVLIGFIILLFINWRLFLGTFAIFILSAIIVVFRAPLLIKRQKILNKKFDKAAGDLSDSLLNIQTIKSSGAEDFQGAKIYKSYREEINSAFKNVTKVWENTDFVQEMIFSLGFVILFSYAIFLLKINLISQGVLVMFLGYLNLIRMPLRMLLWQWLTVQRGLSGIKRTRELLFLSQENYKKKGKILDKVEGKVEYKNVSFSYPRKNLILDKISFTVPAGKKIALVGGSGEGKTTTADLLSLYNIPDSGKILIDGVEIRDFNLKFLRSIIAYVPQEIILFNDTIKNNILYGKPKAKEEEIIEAARAANIHSFIESLPKKYDTLVGERGVKLSTGQKQRLAIARAVIRNPKILVLDEATSSLDVESEKIVQEALERLVKGRTTFIIAHRLSTVRNADEILVLKEAKIAERGDHESLMKRKGFYYKFYTLQFKQPPSVLF